MLTQLAEAEREAREIEADRQFASATLKREINWSGYEKNGFVTKKELGMLLDYDKQKPEEQNDLLAEKANEYAAVFIKAIDAIRAKDTVEYVIVLIDQLLATDPTRIQNFLNQTDIDPFGPLLRVLTSTEQGYHPYVIARTAAILGSMIAQASQSRNMSPSTQQYLQSFVKYVTSQLSMQRSNRELCGTLCACKNLLMAEVCQQAFVDADGIKILANLFAPKEQLNAQLIYNVGFNLWLLAYDRQQSVKIMESGILKRIAQLLKTSAMEKCIRINIALMRNLIQHNINDVNEYLVGLGLLPIVETLSKRRFKDADINSDLEAIQQQMNVTIDRLSTFDTFHSEVMSGNLQWTPPHKNEIFWRENINQFEHKNYEIVAKLIECLSDEDDNVREIACFDLGEFARFSSEGKRVIHKLGGKNKLMLNLAHKNPKVAKAALLATQKIMVANWEYLAKTSAGGVSALVSKGGK